MANDRSGKNNKSNTGKKEPSSIRIGRRYRAERLNGPYDVIVVGSGAGGLATAACLSKMGKKVLVLEQHYTAGGFSHTYERNGWEWDVGVHFINDVGDKGTLFNKIYDFISDGRLRWQEIPAQENILYVQGQQPTVLPIRKDEVADSLKALFPEETKTIDKILAHCDRVMMKAMPLLLINKLSGTGLVNSTLSKATGFLTPKDAYRSSYEVLREFTDNEHLINTLTWWWFVVGLPVKELPFFVFASALQNNGAMFYPVGGASRIAESIIPVIQKSGGELFTYAKVEEIVVDNGRAIGVKMADGITISAPIVVSNAGVNNTFRHLVPNSISHKLGYISELDKLKRSVGHLNLFIGLKGDKDTLSLPGGNYLHYPSEQISDSVAAFDSDVSAEFPFLYFSFPSSKDPDWERRHPGKASCLIFTYLDNFDAFSKWADKPWGKRGDDYEQLKEEIAQRMLKVLYRYYPQLEDKIDYYELSTPLSTRTFCLYEHGEAFGLAHDEDRFASSMLSARTKIKGLYLTGQDTFMVGHTPSTLSGVLTACSILGLRQRVALINKIRHFDGDGAEVETSSGRNAGDTDRQESV